MHGVLNGYEPIAGIERYIRNVVKGTNAIVFLALGQPLQEQVLMRCSELEGDVCIVACGAHWKQLLGFEKGVGGLWERMGLQGVGRFWSQPRELFKRTAGSIVYLLTNLRGSVR